MIRHSVEVCPDDLETLTQRLDALAVRGDLVISVMWQPRVAGPEDQVSAMGQSGSFVIVSQTEAAALASVPPDEEMDGIGRAERVGSF